MNQADVRRTAVSTAAFACVVILSASIMARKNALDGPAGFLFFLLIAASPFVIASGVSLIVWRSLARVSTPWVGLPERRLLTVASFVLICSGGPLAITLSIMLITGIEGSLGASGVWALVGISFSGVLCFAACVITVGRAILTRSHVSHESRQDSNI
jgi:hypothetical protein